jgi:hypothetical protein
MPEALLPEKTRTAIDNHLNSFLYLHLKYKSPRISCQVNI